MAVPTKTAASAPSKTPTAATDLTGLVGRSIVAVGPLPKDLLSHFGWDEEDPSAPYVVLDDGTRLFPSRDEEGNGPGALFWEHPKGAGGQIFANTSMGAPRRVND